ncbi:MAG: ATP-binding cassette domain-containing protein [Spirochaetota bacterium]
MNLIEIEGLTKGFKLHLTGEKIVRGCEDVSFDLHPAEFLAITGSTGSGKSTVLKCMYREYLPSSGAIRYRKRDGEGVIDLCQAEDDDVLCLRQTDIGYVSQEFHVIPRVSALEIVAEPLLFLGVPSDDAHEKASELLETLRIPKQLYDLYPFTFSGGEKQRINIARTLVCQPNLLLLDEPTSALDQETRTVIEGLLAQLKEQGTTIVGIFHDLSIVERLADRVLVMADGKVQSLN